VLRPVSLDAEVDAAGVFDQLADQQLGLVTAERGPGGLEAVLGLHRHGGGGLGCLAEGRDQAEVLTAQIQRERGVVVTGEDARVLPGLQPEYSLATGPGQASREVVRPAGLEQPEARRSGA